MAFLRNQRKLAAFLRETPEITRNGRAENTIDPELAQDYISHVSEEIELKVTKKTRKRNQWDRVSYLGCTVKT